MDNNESKFMFVHQADWQQRLLLRYGSELELMDPTCKTTKYSIPLFFICVHTNVGYKVVAEFLCQNEEKECNAELLILLKSWNLAWNPKDFMVDYSTAEINVIWVRKAKLTFLPTGPYIFPIMPFGRATD